MHSLKVSMQNQIVGKLSIDRDENYYFGLIKKLSAFIGKRANRFRDIGLEMGLVSFP